MKRPTGQDRMELIRRIFGGDETEAEKTETGMRPYPIEGDCTWQDRFIRTLMATTVFLIGLVASTVMGLPRTFAEQEETRWVALGLVFVGLLFCHAGAAVVQHFCQAVRLIGKVAFCLCFLVSATIIVVAMTRVFAHPGPGFFLMMVGFLSAAFASVGMK